MNRRILICAPRVPEFDRESGSRRIFHLIEFLREADWSVCFVAQDQTGGQRYVRLLQQRGVETFLGFGPQTDELIASRRFDVAVLAFWHLAEKHMPVIRRLSPSTRIIVDMIDLHFLRDARRIFRKLSSDPLADTLDAKYGSDLVGELNAYAMADGVLAVSQKEADLVNDFIGDSSLAFVVPDNEDLPVSPVPFDDRNGILFIGNFWHHPNVTAAEYLCKQILPKLDPGLLAEHPVYIVGNALDDHVRAFGQSLSNIRFVGWVPSIMPYLNQARITVIPLLDGAGTKRKLIQALMVGTPTVTTSIGTEGLDLKHGQHVLVADDPATFADSIAQLIKDRELWERLNRSGRNQVLTSHGRQNASERLMQALDLVISKTPKVLGRTHQAALDSETQQQAYENTIQRTRDVVAAVLPDDATVMVISNGDDAFLQLSGRRAWHFPQTEDGRYAGYHPANSADAIAHLEALRKKGGNYLVFPSTSFWWLDYYAEFKHYLETNYRKVRGDEHCSIFTLCESSNAPVSAPAANLSESVAVNTELLESLRPIVPEPLKSTRSNGHARRNKVLVLGVYLAAKQTNVDDIVSVILKTSKYKVHQRWVALGGEPVSKQVADVTVDTLVREKPKFQIMNDLLAAEKLEQYEFVVLIDDDVVVPHSFLDHFISLQERLGFSIAQPARTSNSYIDHPIVEQQRGVLARQTLFVEIGPVVSFHKKTYGMVFPFDLTSPMGWGYENVWAHRLDQAQMKMGIIDAVPVDHSLRKPVAYYRWDEANQQQRLFLSKHEHIPLDQCFRVLDVFNLTQVNNPRGKAISTN